MRLINVNIANYVPIGILIICIITGLIICAKLKLDEKKKIKENTMNIDSNNLLYITPRQIKKFYYDWQIEMLDNNIVKVIGMFDPNDIRYFKLLKA